MSRILDRIIVIGMLIAVAFTALAHGAVEAWALAIFQFLVILFIELWAIRMILEGRARINVPAAAFPLAGLILLAVVQSFSWPGADGNRTGFSLDIAQTRGSVVTLVVMAAAFLIAANFWSSRERLRNFGWFLTLFGFAMAVFALIQGFTWNGHFYWVRPMGGLISPYGPFPSHNNFAGYMELFVPAAASIALFGKVSPPARMFCAFAAVIMSLSIIFSLSRGGMISLTAGLLFLSVMSLHLVRQRRKAVEEEWAEEDGREATRARGASWLPVTGAVSAIVVGIIVGLLWLGPDSVASRLTQGSLSGGSETAGSFYGSRGWIWRDTWRIFVAHPVLGAGLGAYTTSFPIYSESDGLVQVSHSHNDYLQILADGGLIGAGLALWFIVVVFRAFGRGVNSRDSWRSVIALGCGAGMFSLLVHSLFDFNLQIPSTALLFLVFAGVIAGIGEKADGWKKSQLEGVV